MPNRIGNRKPPRPPARPTIPVTTPMLSAKSSATYLKVDAMPNANTPPSTNVSNTKPITDTRRCRLAVPSIVWITKSVGGYDSRNRQIHATHNPHHVTLWAPKRSARPPPTARNTEPGNEKPAANADAMTSDMPYSAFRYCGIHSDSAVKPPNVIE